MKKGRWNSKEVKKLIELIEKYGARCFIYLENMDASLLQVDHRVPYEIGGEKDITDISHFMLLSASANRTKSWTCEHCSNWTQKDENVCRRCFWAYPENYDHVAGKPEKILLLVFSGDEIADYNRLLKLCGTLDKVRETIRILIHDHVNQ